MVEKNISRRNISLDENFYGKNFGLRVAETKMPLRVSCSGIGDVASRLFFFGDLDFYFRGDVAEDFDFDGEIAEGLQRVVELDLAFVDLVALGFEGFGDVAVGNGAEELVV